MNTPTQQYQQVSAGTHTMKVNLSPAQPVKSQQTVSVSFDSVKHLLSGKPLRRPNRTRPTE